MSSGGEIGIHPEAEPVPRNGPPPWRVLLVEDNDGDALLLRESLADARSGEFAIHRVAAWDEAVQSLRGERFDVMLLDLDLPDSSGIVTVRRALRDAARVPIVVQTGCDDEATAVAAVQAGAQDFLVKGQLDGRAVARVLRYAIERHQMLSELRLAREREHHLATHDGLTGLANRHLFFDRLTQSLRYASRYGSTAAILYIDLDQFKSINDTLGHPTGDALLVEVASRIRRACRQSDTVARLGGDEFAVVLNHVPQARHAAQVARNLLCQLAQPMRLGGEEIRVQASVGIALYPRDGASAESLVRGADRAMYEAKSAGGYAIRLSTKDAPTEEEDSSVFAEALAEALAREEIVVFYQPQVKFPEGRITGFEALARWRHPRLGLLLPAQFVPIAEESGLIEALGDLVLESACRQLREWQALAAGGLRMAVNLSARQFQHGNLADRISTILRNSAVRLDDVELEVTEDTLLSDLGAASAELARLRALGVRIAIDDFGTGYSSLSALRHFPVDALKLDRSFVRDVNHDPRGEAITAATIALAKGMAMDLVAVGVENTEQMDFLLARGCTQMQGELFGRPLPPQAISRRLERPGDDCLWPKSDS